MEASKAHRPNTLSFHVVAFALIDWHDFVVVDTIEFVDSDEMMDLPPPMTLSDLENMTLAQRKANLVLNQDTFQEDGGDMEMDVSLLRPWNSGRRCFLQ